MTGFFFDFDDTLVVSGIHDHDVYKGELLPTFDILKSKDPSHSYILTARYSEDRKYVHTFLKSKDVHLPYSNIICVNSGDDWKVAGFKKRAVLRRYLKETYKEVHFWDDNSWNIGCARVLENCITYKVERDGRPACKSEADV